MELKQQVKNILAPMDLGSKEILVEYQGMESIMSKKGRPFECAKFLGSLNGQALECSIAAFKLWPNGPTLTLREGDRYWLGCADSKTAFTIRAG